MTVSRGSRSVSSRSRMSLSEPLAPSTSPRSGTMRSRTSIDMHPSTRSRRSSSESGGGNHHLVDSEHFHDGRHLDQSAEYRETGQAPVR